MLLAALALDGLWLFRPLGWLRLLLIAQALMFADLLLYCTPPEFLGLPHYLVFGGSSTEPTHLHASTGPSASQKPLTSVQAVL